MSSENEFRRLGQSAKVKSQLDSHPVFKARNVAEELAQRDWPYSYYVGIAGVYLEEQEISILDGDYLVKNVTNSPGMVNLFSACDISDNNTHIAARYASDITCEICVGNRVCDGQDVNTILNNAWSIAALIKIHSNSNAPCPVSTTVSWDTVAAKQNNELKVYVLDDVSKYISVGTDNVISLKCLTLVERDFSNFQRLRLDGVSRRFGLASSIAYTWCHTSDVRLAFSSLWCALDALFGVQNDRPVTKKLIERICAWLPDRRYDRIRSLYNTRSDAIHGREITDIYANQLLETYHLLRDCIKKVLETGEVPLPDWH